jgi:hypothetical protein
MDATLCIVGAPVLSVRLPLSQASAAHGLGHIANKKKDVVFHPMRE